jgi:hypothetical protein
VEQLIRTKPASKSRPRVRAMCHRRLYRVFGLCDEAAAPAFAAKSYFDRENGIGVL